MNDNDVRRLSYRLFILSLLTISLIFVTGGMTKSQGNNHPVEDAGSLHVPVRVRQLSQDGEISPVQLVCQEAQLAAPNELNGFSCKLINDTNKAITAVSAAYTIIIEKPDGRGTSDTGFLTLDTAIHPDFKAKKPILPRESYPIEKMERTSYEGGVIRGVVVSLDYVEFEDKTTLGPDRNGSRAITSGREGAAKFKEWLVKMYRQEGKSVEAVAAVLSGQEYPSELGLADPGLRRGADYYRTRLRGVQADHGNAEIKRLLDQ